MVLNRFESFLGSILANTSACVFGISQLQLFSIQLQVATIGKNNRGQGQIGRITIKQKMFNSWYAMFVNWFLFCVILEVLRVVRHVDS
jgi:hypothetical protein